MPNVKTLFLYTESATHAGTGTGLGAVDLPIQREQTTGYPIIQGSGVKGAIRSQSPAADAEKAKDKNVVFGPASSSDAPPTHAGAAAFGDARVLLFPVRALNGVFVWTTCRSVLARFVRDCQPAGVPPLPDYPNRNQARVSNMAIANDAKIVLEEYLYHAQLLTESQEPADNWAVWLAQYALPVDNGGVYDQHYFGALQNRLVILPDEDFRDFTLYATQVVTRVALNDATKTVEQGPFTMELLPADTLLYVPITAQNPRAESTYFRQRRTAQDVLDWFEPECFDANNVPPRIQIGGDETVGYGRVALRWGA